MSRAPYCNAADHERRGAAAFLGGRGPEAVLQSGGQVARGACGRVSTRATCAALVADEARSTVRLRIPVQCGAAA